MLLPPTLVLFASAALFCIGACDSPDVAFAVGAADRFCQVTAEGQAGAAGAEQPRSNESSSPDRDYTAKWRLLGDVREHGGTVKYYRGEIYSLELVVPSNLFATQEEVRDRERRESDLLMTGVEYLRTGPVIRKLLICCDSFDDDALEGIPPVPTVEIVDFSGTSIQSSAGALIATRFPNASWIFLGETGVSDETVEAVCQLEHLNQLYLDRTEISDDAFQYIAETQFLVILSVDGNDVSDAGIHRLGTMPHLRWLSLIDTKVTDDAFLEASEQFSRLDTVWLSGTHVTDVTLRHLEAIESLKKIVAFGTGITPEGIQRMQRVRPNVELDY